MSGLERDLLIDPRKPLPANLVIQSAGTHFYSCGLTLFRFASEDRKNYFNPFLIYLLNFVSLIRCFVALLTPHGTGETYMLIGDFPTLIKSRVHFNIILISYFTMAIMPQTIHFWHYYRNKSPTYMKPFKMLSGQVSPQSIGITNSEHIIKLVNKTRQLFKLSEFNSYVLFTAAFVLAFAPMVNSYEWWQIPLIGLPWALQFGISAYYAVLIHSWHIVYFYIICRYLKFKIRDTNEKIKSNIKQYFKISSDTANNIVKTLYGIFDEIGEYNRNYWSMHLFWILVCFECLTSICLFVTVYGEMLFLPKLAIFYGNFMIFFILTFIINTASSVNYEVKKSYKILNTYYMTGKFNNNSGAVKIKLLTLIERIGKKRIGFYCWKLFIFNYFRCYEMIAVIIVFFLKIVDMSR